MGKVFARLVFFVTFAILGIFSIAIYALKHYSLQRLPSWMVTIYPQEGENGRLIANLPAHIDGLPAKIVALSANMTAIIAFFAIPFAVCAWPDGKRTYCFKPSLDLPLVLLFNAIFSLIALAVYYESRRASASFDPFYESPDGEYGFWYQYDSGVFDLETWSCQLAEYSADFKMQCWTERRAWETTVAYCVMTFAATVVAWGTLRTGEEGSRMEIIVIKREEDKKAAVDV